MVEFLFAGALALLVLGECALVSSVRQRAGFLVLRLRSRLEFAETAQDRGHERVELGRGRWESERSRLERRQLRGDLHRLEIEEVIDVEGLLQERLESPDLRVELLVLRFDRRDPRLEIQPLPLLVLGCYRSLVGALRAVGLPKRPHLLPLACARLPFRLALILGHARRKG